jgi:hypothetical protein
VTAILKSLQRNFENAGADRDHDAAAWALRGAPRLARHCAARPPLADPAVPPTAYVHDVQASSAPGGHAITEVNRPRGPFTPFTWPSTVGRTALRHLERVTPPAAITYDYPVTLMPVAQATGTTREQVRQSDGGLSSPAPRDVAVNEGTRLEIQIVTKIEARWPSEAGPRNRSRI